MIYLYPTWSKSFWAVIWFLPIAATETFSAWKVPKALIAGFSIFTDGTTGHSLLPLAKYYCAESLAKYSKNNNASLGCGAFRSMPPPEILICPHLNPAQADPCLITIEPIDQPMKLWTNMKFGLPSTIRTCDLRLRRIRGWSKHQRIQWLKSKILSIDFE